MKKKLSVLLATLLMVGGLTACNNTTSDEAQTPPATEQTTIKIAALKGPTAMGMAKMIHDQKDLETKAYDIEVLNAVDEVIPKVATGEVDIAAVPSNVSSALYNKTEGKIVTLAINTLGVLYVVENGDTVHSVSDLKGKTIYSSGKGATPEYVLNYILKGNGLDPEKDVTIEYKSEHAECLAALTNDKNGIAVLPQPFVTAAQMKNDGLRVALDFTKEWTVVNESHPDQKTGVLITGVIVAQKEFVEQNPELVKAFLEDYKKSIEFTNSNIDEAAALIAEADIVPEPIAKRAIPLCNIVYIDGGNMKELLGGYLNVLYEANPKSIGGKLPGEEFYYIQ
jgi:hypothetical protein